MVLVNDPDPYHAFKQGCMNPCNILGGDLYDSH